MKYFTELHCHSSETSGCSSISGEELVRIYKKNDYHAITITDHYEAGFFGYAKKNNPKITWEESVDCYLRGYRAAKKEGEKLAVNVILGMELRFLENNNDYLVFGVTEELLYDNPELYLMGIEKFIEFSREHNLITIQAHPFRNGMVQTASDFLDGIEVYNAHPWHHSNNIEAQKLYQSVSRIKPYIKTVGSDCHNLGHEARAAMVSDILPKNSIEVKEILQNEKCGFYLNVN